MPSRTRLSRRRAISHLGAAAIAAATLRAQAQPTPPVPTPSDAEGPFYPFRLPAHADADLTVVPGRPGRARGTPLALSGRVVGTDGKPLAGTRVELWQCDAGGVYHHVNAEPASLDPNFQGYGVLTTDADGRYAFVTIRPVRYGGRPPHLHFKLAHPEAAALTTQLYPRGESSERGFGFGLSSRASRALLEFDMTPGPAQTLVARYDFVLRAG